MKITIGKPVSKKNPKFKYKIKIEFMYGDADGEGHEELLISEGNPLLERFLEFLDRCIAFYETSGMGGGDDYTGVSDWYFFFNDEYDEEEADLEEKDKPVFEEGDKKWLEEFAFGWHTDPGTDGQNTSSIENFTITYFDGSGIEHHVKIRR